jgi:hypothetical protein
VSLCIPSSYRCPDHDPPLHNLLPRVLLGRFAGLKHRQLACQVGVIITTKRIQRTSSKTFNLLGDSAGWICYALLIELDSGLLILPLRLLASCTSASARRMTRHVARVDYLTYAVRPGASACRAARLVARRQLLRLAPLVVNYFDYAARSGASARRVARHAARRTIRRRLLRLRHAIGCLGTSHSSSRGSSRRSSSTTSPTPRVRVRRLVARLVVDNFTSRRLVVDYFAYAARLGASAHRAAHHAALLAALRRLRRLRRASGCLSEGSDGD